MAEDEEQFAKWALLTWEVEGTRHLVPAVTIKRTHHNRLAPHKRPYRKGARHDNTGPDPVAWEVGVLSGATVHAFFPQVPESFYPSGIKALELSADREDTGTLFTPYGEKRCKLQDVTTTWSRTENGVDAQQTMFVWVEDNEDDTDLSAFEPPTARVAGDQQVDTFLGFAAQAGAGAGDFFDAIKEGMRELKALANYPGETLAQTVARVSTITNAVKSTYDAYRSAPTAGAATMSALLNDPLAGPALRKLEEIVDTACKAAEEEAKRSGSKPRTLKYYDRTVSIFEVAVDVSQGATDLMRLNPALDPYEIKRGTPVTVFA